MSNTTELTLAFINKRPAAAARVLASLPVDDAARFIDSIPTGYAVKVITPLYVTDAVAILQSVDETTAMAVLRDLEFAAAAAILRQLAPAHRQACLAGLPRRQKNGFETTLAYAPNTVGAHMSTTVDVLSASDTAADALRLKTLRHDSRSTLTFVVDDERVFIGAVPLLSVLRHPERTPLSELVDTSMVTVSPQLQLSRLEDMDVSRQFSEIPVISRRRQPMGVIFSRSIPPGRPVYAAVVRPTGESFAGAVLRMMGHSALELAKLLAPESSDRSGHGGSNVS